MKKLLHKLSLLLVIALHKITVVATFIRTSNRAGHQINRFGRTNTYNRINNSSFKDDHGRNSVGSKISLVPISAYDSQLNFLSSPESYRLCIGKRGQLRPTISSTDKTTTTDTTDSSNNPYILCIAEEDDLPAITRLTIDAFGTAVVTLSGDLNEFERALIGPTVGLWNVYTDAFAFTEVLSGLRSRTSERRRRKRSSSSSSSGGGGGADVISPPRRASNAAEAVAIAQKSSVVLVLARETPVVVGGEGGGVDCVATVEIRLQPTDAKIPFSQPWLDDIERRVAKILGVDTPPGDKILQPYLSNLCVADNFRGRQIGRALVRCVEKIALNTWGYSKLYLHVELENTAAIGLYKSEGFRDVGVRWNPFWAGKAAEIGYFVKTFK